VVARIILAGDQSQIRTDVAALCKSRPIGDREDECQRCERSNTAHLARQRRLWIDFRCELLDLHVTATNLFVEVPGCSEVRFFLAVVVVVIMVAGLALGCAAALVVAGLAVFLGVVTGVGSLAVFAAIALEVAGLAVFLGAALEVVGLAVFVGIALEVPGLAVFVGAALEVAGLAVFVGVGIVVAGLAFGRDLLSLVMGRSPFIAPRVRLGASLRRHPAWRPAFSSHLGYQMSLPKLVVA
jgi:hypothetical protein